MTAGARHDGSPSEPCDPALDGLVALAAELCGTAAAALVIEARGVARVLAGRGLLAGAVPAPLPRDFCDETRAGGLLRAAPGARALTSAPLVDPGGLWQGALIVFDLRARRLSPVQQHALRRLAAQAVTLLLSQQRTRALEALGQASPDLIFILDAFGGCTWASARGAAAVGLSPGELRGKTFCELGFPAEVTGHFDRLLERVVRSGAPLQETQLYLVPAGERRLAYTLIPVAGASGAVESIAVAARDVTGQARAEREARESDQLLRAILEGSGDGIFVKDAAGRYRIINSAGARLLGRTPAEVIGRLDAELMEEANAARIRARDRETMESGRLVTYEIDASLSGERRVLHTAKGPWRDHEGNIVGVFGVSRDLTGRKRMEEALRANGEMLEAALQAEQAARARAEEAALRVQRLQAVVAALSSTLSPDEVGRITLERTLPAVGASSGAVFERSGAGRKLLAWLGEAPLAGEPDQLFEPALDSLAPLFAGTPDEIAHALGVLAAAPSPRAWAALPLLVESDPIGMLVLRFEGPRLFSQADREFLLALSQHCALALHRARLFRLAEDAIRAREDLLAIVSHDLRSSLSVLRIAGTLMERQLPPGAPASARDPVVLLQRTEASMTRLVMDLLDSARIDAGGLPVQPVVQDALPIAREAVDLAAPLAAQRRLALRLELDGGAAPARVDRERLLQVFANLIGNALKFTAAGAVTVRGERRAGEVVFSVADTGPGIDEAHLPHLFERYWRAPRAAGSPGVGLGLFIARGIVEAHGGQIRVTSAPGLGTTFWFSLPLA